MRGFENMKIRNGEICEGIPEPSQVSSLGKVRGFLNHQIGSPVKSTLAA
jgi:hypothetical protein